MACTSAIAPAAARIRDSAENLEPIHGVRLLRRPSSKVFATFGIAKPGNARTQPCYTPPRLAHILPEGQIP